jgi:tripartite-type tricarboxylate transporter receptor subunit TctC
VGVGSGADIALRTVVQKMSENMEIPIVIENLQGAAGLLGAAKVASVIPNGYTIGGFNEGPVNSVPQLYPNVPYDPFTSFAPIGLVARISFVMIVSPDLPVKTVKEFIALSHTPGSQLSYASPGGNGSPMHLAMEIFKAATKTNALHVPYRSTGAAATDVMAGRVQVTITSLAPVLELIRAKKVNALGVASLNRSPLLPDVPTIAESGVPGFTYSTWTGLVAPKNTPQPIILKLNSEMIKAINDPAIKQRLISLGFEPVGSTPEQLELQIRTGYNNIARIIKNAKITAD